MLYTITKRFKFSAAHSVPTLADDEQCKRVHGHNYIVELELTSDHLNEHGFVINVCDLHPFKKYINDTFDHRYINDVVDFVPTSETLAAYFYGWAKIAWPQVSACTVIETDTIRATYRPLG